jgi:hypothetical protein
MLILKVRPHGGDTGDILNCQNSHLVMSLSSLIGREDGRGSLSLELGRRGRSFACVPRRARGVALYSVSAAILRLLKKALCYDDKLWDGIVRWVLKCSLSNPHSLLEQWMGLCVNDERRNGFVGLRE